MPQSPFTIPLNRPGEDDRQIKSRQAYFHNDEMLYHKDDSLCIRLYDLNFRWFSKMLDETPHNLDLATLLRERTLQYDGRGLALEKGQGRTAFGTLRYIQVRNIELYIFHCSSLIFDPCSPPEVRHTIPKSRPPPRHRHVYYLPRMRRRFRRRLGLEE
jgi:hypothetical protein